MFARRISRTYCEILRDTQTDGKILYFENSTYPRARVIKSSLVKVNRRNVRNTRIPHCVDRTIYYNNYKRFAVLRTFFFFFVYRAFSV